jgi:hydrogenase maturation protease
VLLIGYGNSLRGDDALGPLAIERLRLLLPDAEVVSCHQLAPELAEPLAHCELAVLVDAAIDGQAGAVRVRRLSPQMSPWLSPEASHGAAGSASLTHHVQPEALLALALALYGHAPEAMMLVTGTGASFESGEGLSEQGRAALDEICRIVPLLVRNFSMRA